MNTARLTRMAMLIAIAVVFCFIPGFAMIPSVSFIRYEFSDIPLLISAFAFGPLAGVGSAAIAILLSFLLGGESGGPYGALMHFIAIGSYVLAAGLIYRYNKTRAGAIVGMLAGVVVMTLLMIPANLVITPLYTGAPVAAIKALLLPGIIPVNAIKGAVTAVITFALYKRVSGFLHEKR